MTQEDWEMVRLEMTAKKQTHMKDINLLQH